MLSPKPPHLPHRELRQRLFALSLRIDARYPAVAREMLRVVRGYLRQRLCAGNTHADRKVKPLPNGAAQHTHKLYRLRHPHQRNEALIHRIHLLLLGILTDEAHKPMG